MVPRRRHGTGGDTAEETKGTDAFKNPLPVQEHDREGIDGGAEYSDIDNLVNTGTIKTLSDGTAKGISVSVNLLGGVATDANTTARAITTGIKGGVGEDLILNQGSIELTAKSNADVLGVSVTLGGYSDSNAESKAESMAIGINAGDSVNTIVSKGQIKVSSEAYADTASVSVNLLGYAAAKGGATASATAIGITSGKEADSIQNEGMIDLMHYLTRMPRPLRCSSWELANQTQREFLMQWLRESMAVMATIQSSKAGPLRRIVTVLQANMHAKDNASKFEPLGSDSNVTDGLVPHAVIRAELHPWGEQHRGLYEKIQTALGKRRQPLGVTITTAGDDRSEIWKEQYAYSQRVVASLKRTGDVVRR